MYWVRVIAHGCQVCERSGAPGPKSVRLLPVGSRAAGLWQLGGSSGLLTHTPAHPHLEQTQSVHLPRLAVFSLPAGRAHHRLH